MAGTLTQHPNTYYVRITEGRVEGFDHSGTHPVGNVYANALLFWLSAGDETIFGIVLCLVGSVIPLIVVWLATLLLPPEAARRNRLAGWLAAFFPPLLLLAATWRYMLVPVLFSLLHLACAVRKPTRPWIWCLGTGSSGLGLLLCRPDLYLAGVLLALVQKTPLAWRLVAVLGPLFLASLHTRIVAGDLSPWGGVTYLWGNLDTGNNPRTREGVIGYADLESVWLEDMNRTPSPSGTTGPRPMRRIIGYVQHQPQLMAESLLMKFARIFDVHRDSALEQRPTENLAYTGPLLLALLLALMGFGLLWGKPASGIHRWHLALACLGYAIPWTVLFSLDRMRIPFQVLWLVLSAYALGEACANRQAQRTVPSPKV